MPDLDSLISAKAYSGSRPSHGARTKARKELIDSAPEIQSIEADMTG